MAATAPAPVIPPPPRNRNKQMIIEAGHAHLLLFTYRDVSTELGGYVFTEFPDPTTEHALPRHEGPFDEATVTPNATP